MALEGSSLSESKRGRRGDKEAADRPDVHMQMNTEQFVHPRSLSLHHTLSISPTEAFCIPHAATVAKETVYSSIPSCQVTFYLFIYLSAFSLLYLSLR